MTNTSSVKQFALFLCLFVLLAGKCHSATLHKSDSKLTLLQSSARFFFWERCEEKQNKEKKITENCCRGNYRCSSEKCKDNRLCSLSAFSNSLWCYNETCTPKDKDKKKDDDKKDDKGKKDDKDNEEPEVSAEETKEEDEEDDKDDKDKNDDKEKTKPTPSVTPSPSMKPTPSTTPSPAASVSPAPSTTPNPNERNVLRCDGIRRRREIRDLSASERQRWLQALISLMNDRDERGVSEWDRLVQIHINFADEAHGGAYFLPWHSLFLLRLENALRNYEPDLALPYWDWSLDSANAAMSEIWTAGYVGGARSGPSPIQNGAFMNLQAVFPFRHTVVRNFNSGVSGGMGWLWSWPSLNSVLNDPYFGAFSDSIESAHGVPHVNIGGDMASIGSAPNDPVFYLHHAFVDRLYYIWLNRHGSNGFSGTHSFRGWTENVSPNRVFGAFDAPVSRTFNLNCIQYVPPRLQGRSKARAQAGTPPDACDIIAAGNGMTKERCERGRKHLMGNSTA